MAKSLRNTVLVMMLAVFVLIGCSLEPAPVDADSGKAAGIPFASSEELSRIAHMDGYADYRVVRPFAVIEMHQVAPTYGWTSPEVSALPVVIYEHGTELPKYYEFPVLQDGKAVGTVTGTARKSIGAPVEFVLGFSRSFDEETSRSIMSGRGTKLVDVGGYPSRLGICNPYTGRSADAGSGLDIEEAEIFQELTVKEFLMSADPEELEELGITEEAIEEMLREYHENRREIEELWEMIEEFREELLQLSDEEIAQESIDASRSAKTISNFELDRWVQRINWFRDGSYGLYCGPSALVRIVLGFDEFGYDASGDMREVKNDYATHKYIRDTIYDELGKGIGDSGVTVFPQLSRVLRKYTDYDLVNLGRFSGRDESNDSGTVIYAWPSYSLIDRTIRETNLPLISLRTSALRYSTWQWHYRVIIGTTSQRNLLFRFRIFGRWREFYGRTNNYYYMIDNDFDGSQAIGPNNTDGTGYWLERAGRYYQIEARPVVRK